MSIYIFRAAVKINNFEVGNNFPASSNTYVFHTDNILIYG